MRQFSFRVLLICAAILAVFSMTQARMQSSSDEMPKQSTITSNAKKPPKTIQDRFRELRNQGKGVAETSDPILGNSVPPYSYKASPWLQEMKEAWEAVKGVFQGWFPSGPAKDGKKDKRDKK